MAHFARIVGSSSHRVVYLGDRWSDRKCQVRRAFNAMGEAEAKSNSPK